MSLISVKQVLSKKDLKAFIRFGTRLYKNHPCFCPPLFIDEMNTFSKKNPALQVSEYCCFLAYKDGKICGRIAGIINQLANTAWNTKRCRFGWFDFIDDFDVSSALLDAVAQWGKSKGMDNLNGPVGFTDFDHQGLLLEGFDYNSPMASLYTYPYYIKHYEKYGFEKEADWIEYCIHPPKEAPERMADIAKLVQERYGLKIVKVHSGKELKKRFGYTPLDVIDVAYQQLYNFQPLTDAQKKYYFDMYFPLINFDFITLVTNKEDELIGVGIGMPSLSAALRKCQGKLFPFGWYYILKALKAKRMTDFDLLLIAVRPDYQNKGVNSLFFVDQIPYFINYGIERVETTAILETNLKNQANYRYFDKIQHKRRRAYVKAL